MLSDTLKDHYTERRIVNTRIRIAAGLMLLLMACLTARLFYLQVIRYREMATQSDDNRVHLKAIPPVRGLIYDTRGKLLATNRSSIILSVVRERVHRLDELLAAIAALLPLSDHEVERYRRLAQQGRPFEAIPLKFDLTDEQIAIIAVHQFRLPGVELNAELVRHYPEDSQYAHSVGYVGRINARELENLPPSHYSGIHTIGKTGLERYYEATLLGKPGYQEVETNARGRVLRILKQQNPTPGQALTLYLDHALQQTAINAIGQRRGSIVAMDPKTGGILTMVSQPAFDPNLFVTGIDATTYRQLNADASRPLYNRASLGEYPPASTLKPIMGLALLNQGIVDLEDSLFDQGWFQLPGNTHRFRNWKRQGHGRVDLKKAIVVSNDTFFYSQATKLGIEALHQFSYQFGLGQRTGIDIYEERAGLLPSQAWKRRLYGQPWYPGETVITIIGQGYMLATPLQLAALTARIANRGQSVHPKLAKNRPDKPRDNRGQAITLADDRYWAWVIEAMEESVSTPAGTAYWRVGHGASYKIAGKTGTAQVVSIAQDSEYNAEQLKESERDHSLFIAFAPVDDPKIAVSVILENSAGASNVARKVMDTYLLPSP